MVRGKRTERPKKKKRAARKLGGKEEDRPQRPPRGVEKGPGKELWGGAMQWTAVVKR